MALFGNGGLLGNGAITTLTPSQTSPFNTLQGNWMGNNSSNVDLAKILKDLGVSVNSAIVSASTNAINAERKEAELNRLFQQTSADKAMKFEADQAELSRQFYKDLSDTAYQRAVLDMKAAGLNPILAYTQGGASSSAVSGATGKVASGSQANIAAAKNADVNVVSAYGQLLNNGLTQLFNGFGKVLKVAGKLLF